MYMKVFLALVIAGSLMFLLWLLKGALRTPVRLGQNESLRLVLRVSGPSPSLENSVSALLWLISEGVLSAELVIEDDGMDEETQNVAALLARDNKRVTLWTRKESSN